MQNLQSQPGTIEYSNTGAAIDSGDVVDLGGRVGIASVDIAATTGTGIVNVVGEYKLAKTASEAYTLNQSLFWSATNEKVTESPASGDPRLGVASEAAALTDSYCMVEINVAATAGESAFIGSGNGSAGGNATAIQGILTALGLSGIMSK